MAFVTIASPSPISNSLWEVYYRSRGRQWTPPLPLDQDYALIKVLYTLFCHSLASGTGSRHLNINTFRLSVPFVPLNFSKLADDDEIFIVGHGDMNGIYAIGPDSEKNTDNLIRFLTEDGSLEKKRKNKPIKIILLSCRAGLGLHKKVVKSTV